MDLYTFLGGIIAMVIFGVLLIFCLLIIPYLVGKVLEKRLKFCKDVINYYLSSKNEFDFDLFSEKQYYLKYSKKEVPSDENN